MLFLSLIWAIPLLVLVVCTVLLCVPKGNYKRASFYGLLVFFLFLSFSAYSTLQLRGSTASIGLIFLPILAMLPMLGGFILGYLHTRYLIKKQNGQVSSGLKMSLFILSALLLLPFIWQANELSETVAENISSDNEALRQREAIRANSDQLKVLLSANPGNEATILKRMMTETQDRTQLIPIANSPYASPEILEPLSHSHDFGVVLSVVRNEQVTEAILQRIYHEHQYPAYFYVDLSQNKKTPLTILRQLYKQRSQNSGITRALARNPQLPADLLSHLATEPDKHVLKNILKRTDITCGQIETALETISELPANNIAWLNEKAQSLMQKCQHK